MNEVLEFVSLMEISEDDAIMALITVFCPPQPGALRDTWLRNTVYGNSAPSTQEIWSLYVKADFRCTKCGGQGRITIDHINGDATDHSPDNLAVLCFDCNREKSSRGTLDKDHRLRVCRSALKLFRQLNRFPAHTEILADSGVNQISGATYMLKYLEKRLQQQINKGYEFSEGGQV